MNETVTHGIAALARSRMWGKVSAFLFVLAIFCIADAVQNMLRTPFNLVDVVVGEEAQVSGAMPHNVQSHEEITFTLENSAGLVFTPTETYRGFWMGGPMWRGVLSYTGKGTQNYSTQLIIIDMIPESDEEGAIARQNPGLIFPVNIWVSTSAKNSSSFSLFMKYSGIPPYVVAVFAGLFAFATGIASFFSFRRAEVLLSGQEMYIIHGVKAEQGGVNVLFGLSRTVKLFGEKKASLLKPNGALVCDGIVAQSEEGKGAAFFPTPSITPKYGWIVRLENFPC